MMPDTVPPWLQTMRDITGTKEFAGGADNPIILSWRTFIGNRYPEMKAYCAQYTHDSIPWCGLTVAYCMAANGIRPVFGETGTQRFLWAAAWRGIGQKLDRPKLGCVMVFTRDGGGHVALYEDEDATRYKVRGGNQSDGVNVMWISKNRFSGAYWPKQVATRPAPKPTTTGAGGVAAGGGVAGTVAVGVQQGWGFYEWSLLVLILVAAGAAAYFLWRWWRARPQTESEVVSVPPEANAPIAQTSVLDRAERIVTMEAQPVAVQPQLKAKPKASRKRKTVKRRRAA